MPLLVAGLGLNQLTQQPDSGGGWYPKGTFSLPTKWHLMAAWTQCPTLESPLIFSIHSFSSLLLPFSLPPQVLVEKTERFSQFMELWVRPAGLLEHSLQKRLGYTGTAPEQHLIVVCG